MKLATDSDIKRLEEACIRIHYGQSDVLGRDWVPDVLKLIMEVRAYRNGLNPEKAEGPTLLLPGNTITLK
jgi:hypothetical protein